MPPRNYELNLPATLAVSAALSLGATMMANVDRSPAEVVDVVEAVVTDQPNTSFELSVAADLPPVIGRFSVHSSMVEGPFTGPTAIHEAHTIPVLRPWALRFSDDPMATLALEDSELGGVVRVVRAAGANGSRVTSVTIEGHASDEDDTVLTDGGDNPGLGIDNAKNVALADTRGRTAGPIAGRTVEAVAGYDVPVTYAPGKEDVDPKLAARVNALAEDMGTTSYSLVTTFNRTPEDLPADALEVLDDLIDGRRVDVTVHTVTELAPPATPTDVEIVPLGFPILKQAPVTAPATAEAIVPPIVKPEVKHNYPQAQLKAPQYTPPVARRQVQPRNYNFSKARKQDGGRMNRNTGGNRSGKRG